MEARKYPTFSICIPNFNYEKYLGLTIESVLAQTYPQFEIIIVDNASTDNSVKVASSYNDPRIKIYSNPYNVGFAPNLQIATSYASNDFINLLSSDDVMQPSALATYADLIMQNPDDYDNLVLASDNEVIDSNGMLTGYKYFDTPALKSFWSDRTQYETYSEKAVGTTRFGGLQLLKILAPELNTLAGFLTIVYSRKLWTRIAGYNAVRAIGPDKFFNYKLLLQNPTVLYVNKPLFQYRFHGSSNAKAYFSTLKQQVDDYLNVLEFGEMFEKAIDLKKEVLVKNFLNRFCFRFSLSNFKNGRYLHSVRTFFFSLASFPRTALKMKLFYVTALMLIFFPLSIVLVKLMRFFKKI